jgi:hypothetical protein
MFPAKEGKSHTSNYCGCRHNKQELRKEIRKTAAKNQTGRVFSSIYTRPDISFAAAAAATVKHNRKDEGPSSRTTTHCTKAGSFRPGAQILTGPLWVTCSESQLLGSRF